MHNFFWKGEDVEGNKEGICLVNWDVVCKLKELRGLGIHDLNHCGRALHQRWCWYHWIDDERPWIDYATPCDDEDLALFQASTNIKLGNEENVVFWHDK
jgi:hypothetical protein